MGQRSASLLLLTILEVARVRSACHSERILLRRRRQDDLQHRPRQSLRLQSLDGCPEIGSGSGSSATVTRTKNLLILKYLKA